MANATSNRTRKATKGTKAPATATPAAKGTKGTQAATATPPATQAATQAATPATQAATQGSGAPRGRVYTYAGQEATLALVAQAPKGMGRDQHQRWQYCQDAFNGVEGGTLTVAEFCNIVQGGRRTYRRAFRAGFFAGFDRQAHPAKADKG